MPERVYTQEELANMSEEDRINLLMKASKIEATAVIRDANGNVVYDEPSLAGTYKET